MATSESTDIIRVPGKSPNKRCGHFGPLYPCNRPHGHTRRHAFIWWHMGGIVRAVWGES